MVDGSTRTTTNWVSYPENDIGNFDDDDIYEVELKPDFCQALQPSNQVEFGVYGHIGNHFGFKEGEAFVPCSQWQQRSDADLERQNNQQRTAEARKGQHVLTPVLDLLAATTKRFQSVEIKS